MKAYDKLTLIISILSLSVSAFVAIKQFQPVKDTLLVEANLGFSNKKALSEIYKSKLPSEIYGKDKTLGGPFVVELTLSNNLSRAVSIKKVDIEYLIDGSGKIYTPAIYNEDIDSINKMFKIEANSVERVSYQVNLPIFMTSQTRTCLEGKVKEKGFNAAFGKCYYEKGIDAFGNKVKYLKSGEAKLMLSYKNEISPSVKVILTTGDGTIINRIVKFSGILPYF